MRIAVRTALAAVDKAFSRILLAPIRCRRAFTLFRSGKDHSFQSALTASDGRDDPLLSESPRTTIPARKDDDRFPAGCWSWLFSPVNGSTSSSSSSTATLCMICSSVNTTLKPLFFRTTTPSIPAKAPDRMRANCPTRSNGCGSIRCSTMPIRNASIAVSGSGAGSPPVPPTTASAPGTLRTLTRCRTLDAHKDVAGEQRQFQRHLGSVAPLPVRAIEREIMLNFALTQVLCNSFFVTAGGVDRKPARGSGYFPANLDHGRFRLDILENASSQGFAILTWVKVFHKGNEHGPKQQSGS